MALAAEAAWNTGRCGGVATSWRTEGFEEIRAGGVRYCASEQTTSLAVKVFQEKLFLGRELCVLLFDGNGRFA